jgi:hypothetical protein
MKGATLGKQSLECYFLSFATDSACLGAAIRLCQRGNNRLRAGGGTRRRSLQRSNVLVLEGRQEASGQDPARSREQAVDRK